MGSGQRRDVLFHDQDHDPPNLLALAPGLCLLLLLVAAPAVAAPPAAVAVAALLRLAATPAVAAPAEAPGTPVAAEAVGAAGRQSADLPLRLAAPAQDPQGQVVWQSHPHHR